MFYVYELIDPRDGLVFYVGKGKGDRYRHHECEAKKGKRGPKCDRIREIWETGRTVRHNIYSRHQDEDDAYNAEADRIDALGLENLTNQIPGGLGGTGMPPGPFVWTELTLRRVKSSVRRVLVLIGGKQPHKMFLGSYDITDICLAIIRKIFADVGEATFCKVLGVEIGRH